ncbi:MAG: hypothetical protein WCD86_04090 [Ktedonobacteraceae bacterium]
MTDPTRADKLTAKYIELRDFKTKFKAEYDAREARITGRMDEIEAEMMTFLNQTGQESSKTAAGTFFKKTTTSAKVADRDFFIEFVMEHNATNFIENRCNKTAVEEYIAEHGTLPPGIDVTRITSISVNRPAKR